MSNAADLPSEFITAAHGWLGPEAEEFLSALTATPHLAVRPNPARGGVGALERVVGPIAHEWPSVPWWPAALLPPASQAAALAAHPLATIGAVYAQDAASLLAVAALEPRPGERILDLCAAPGGKSTAILDRLMGQGILVSNDIDRGRARDLARTLEQWGARATIVSQADPRQLAVDHTSYFDRVLVDAPCSGEAMFGRRERAGRDWSPEHIRGCALRQQRLLDSARQLVRPGGILVYTTCTFNPQENEDVIAAYLNKHGDDRLDDLSRVPGVSPGRPDLVSASHNGRCAELSHCARIWPHRAPGMGHFAARIVISNTGRTSAGKDQSERQARSPKRQPDNDTPDVEVMLADVAPHLLSSGEEVLVRGTSAFLIPRGQPRLLSQQAIAPGLQIAEKRGTTWRPAHTLAMALNRTTAARVVDLSDAEAASFLSGHPSLCAEDDGLVLALWQDFPLGWARRRRGALTSLLPSGLRLPTTVDMQIKRSGTSLAASRA